MSLQEGIAAPRLHVYRHPLGRYPDPQTEPPQCLQPNLYPQRAVCGTSPQYSLPRLRAHSSQAEQPAARSRRNPHPLLHLPGEGGREAGERPVCSVATSGCPKRSEDGFPAGARNMPPRPVRPKLHPKPLAQPPHPNPKIKSPATKSGALRAADGNRTRVSGLGSVRSTIELQPHLFQCIAPACWA